MTVSDENHKNGSQNEMKNLSKNEGQSRDVKNSHGMGPHGDPLRFGRVWYMLIGVYGI